MGCSVKGTPYYWLEHPDTYPIERMDFSEIFRVSAFNENDEFIFDIDYDAFENVLEKKKDGYSRKFLYKKINEPFDINQFIPMFAIARIDLEKGCTSITYQNSSSIYSCPDSSIRSIEEYNGSIRMDTEDYINDIIETTKSYFSSISSIHKVVVPVELRSKYSTYEASLSVPD